MPKANETVLAVAQALLAVYFTVLLVSGLRRYLRFKRLLPTAVATWSAPRPGSFHVLLLLGAIAAGVAVLNGMQQRPFHHVYAQAAIAAYFALMVPLLLRIQQGLYRDGVWADAGFLRYEEIGRMAFRETPDIELILLPRRGSPAFRLRVPPDEYGAVRKILEEKIRSQVLHTEPRLLGL